MRKVEIYIDGASSGNPGPAGVGVVVCQDESVIKNLSYYIGETTNNIAEYTALIYALQEALILKADIIEINTDSELLFYQLNRKYKVKSSHIKPLFEQVQHLTSGFKTVSFKCISRKYNRGADKLAKEAIKRQAQKMTAR